MQFQLLGDADVVVEYLAYKLGWDIRPHDNGFLRTELVDEAEEAIV